MRQRYEAVVLRYVPDVVAGESLNVGVVLTTPEGEFAGAKFLTKFERLGRAFPQLDRVHLRRAFRAIRQGVDQVRNEGPLLHRPSVERLVDSLVSREDAAIQRSEGVVGLTTDPEKTLEQLFRRYVSAAPQPREHASRQDKDVWTAVEQALRTRGLSHRLAPVVVKGKHFEQKFEHSWRNGRLNAAQALSFDLAEASAIVDKATKWTGKVMTLAPSHDPPLIHFVVGLPSADAPAAVLEAARECLSLLRESFDKSDLARVITERDVPAFVERIETDLSHPHAQ